MHGQTCERLRNPINNCSPANAPILCMDVAFTGFLTLGNAMSQERSLQVIVIIINTKLVLVLLENICSNLIFLP